MVKFENYNSGYDKSRSNKMNKPNGNNQQNDKNSEGLSNPLETIVIFLEKGKI